MTALVRGKTKLSDQPETLSKVAAELKKKKKKNHLTEFSTD